MASNINKGSSHQNELLEKQELYRQQRLSQIPGFVSDDKTNFTAPLQHFSEHPHNLPFGIMNSLSSNFISKEGGADDLGELDQALFLYLDGQEPSTTGQDQRQNSGMRPPTLNIFPSQPMHVDPSSNKPNTALINYANPKTKASDSLKDVANPRAGSSAATSGPPATEPAKAPKREANRKGVTSSSEQEGPKTPDPKTLRRLAQNREAARKSRLRKKAYVQQLELSRMKLNQLEQEVQRARSQGMFLAGGHLLGADQPFPHPLHNITSDAGVFDMEYGRWEEEEERLMSEVRAAVREGVAENELRRLVENCLAHYEQALNLKAMVAKSDAFHLLSGLWKTPAERCFLWIGDFRPSHLIKIIMGEIEGLTQHQIVNICGLQQSTQESEESLSQALEALYQSLSETIASDSLSCPPNMGSYMGLMALAVNKLSALEGFLRQADNLRHQTVHRVHQILTVSQGARCLLAVAEYFHRLRALSSLWLARPRLDSL